MQKLELIGESGEDIDVNQLWIFNMIKWDKKLWTCNLSSILILAEIFS